MDSIPDDDDNDADNNRRRTKEDLVPKVIAAIITSMVMYGTYNIAKTVEKGQPEIVNFDNSLK